MRTVIFIDGGAGRVISAIPALLKFAKNNPDNDFNIVLPGWEDLYFCIPELQDKTFNLESKGIFDSIIKCADEIISPEPYRLPEYINQKVSISQAFDILINKEKDKELSAPILKTTKSEKTWAKNFISEVKNKTKKNKVIVFQPFGKESKPTLIDSNNLTLETFDASYRSFNSEQYLKLVQKLNEDYAIIFMGEKELYHAKDEYTIKQDMPLRNWISVIEEADYFLGIDSVGQHIARAMNTQGMVIFGSTFPINTSYPEFFHILEKIGNKKYVPIRISDLESRLANVYNENMSDFSEDLEDMYEIIIKDIEAKTNPNENISKDKYTGIKF